MIEIADCGLWNVDLGMWIVECGLWNVDLGMWIVECGFGNVDCGMWIVECGLWIWVYRFAKRNSGLYICVLFETP